jgi:hypothetical protein
VKQKFKSSSTFNPNPLQEKQKGFPRKSTNLPDESRFGISLDIFRSRWSLQDWHVVSKQNA